MGDWRQQDLHCLDSVESKVLEESTGSEPDKVQSVTDSAEQKEAQKFVAKRLPQYFAALATHLTAIALGSSWFWSATGVPSMENSGDFDDLSPRDRSWIMSAPMLGALIVGPLVGYCLNRFGRKKSLMWSSVPAAVSWFTVAFCNNIPIILFCRVIIGGYVSCIGIIGPLLIAESVEAPIRGMLMCMYEFVICIGTLMIYILGSYYNWHVQAVFAGIIPILGFIVLYFIPESPYYLMEKNQDKEALKSLLWLRGAENSNQVAEEMNEVIETVKSRTSQTNISWRDALSDPAVVKPTLLSMALMTFFQGTYINVVLNTTVEIFQSAGSQNEYLSTILVGVIQMVSTLVPMTMSDKFGRRILVLISLVWIVISLVGLGAYFHLRRIYGESSELMESLTWVPLTSLLSYIVACSIGIVPLSWVITAEISPPKAKGLASGIVGIWNRVIGFIFIFTFWDAIEAIGHDGTYWMIAGMNFIAFVVFYFCVPETRGKTLEEIQAHFSKSRHMENDAEEH